MLNAFSMLQGSSRVFVLFPPLPSITLINIFIFFLNSNWVDFLQFCSNNNWNHSFACCWKKKKKKQLKSTCFFAKICWCSFWPKRRSHRFLTEWRNLNSSSSNNSIFGHFQVFFLKNLAFWLNWNGFFFLLLVFCSS